MFIKLTGLWIHLINNKNLIRVQSIPQKHINLIPIFPHRALKIPISIIHLLHPLPPALINPRSCGSFRILNRNIKPLNRNMPFLIIPHLLLCLGRRSFNLFFFYLYLCLYLFFNISPKIKIYIFSHCIINLRRTNRLIKLRLSSLPPY